MDREKVKKGIWQCWLPSTEEGYETQCHDCPYYEPGITLAECMTALRTDALAMLDEQEEQIENLKQTAQSMMEGICLLKEQEAVEPFHRCIGKDFSLIEDSHFDYCPYCGKHITWAKQEGR